MIWPRTTEERRRANKTELYTSRHEPVHLRWGQTAVLAGENSRGAPGPSLLRTWEMMNPMRRMPGGRCPINRVLCDGWEFTNLMARKRRGCPRSLAFGDLGDDEPHAPDARWPVPHPSRSLRWVGIHESHGAQAPAGPTAGGPVLHPFLAFSGMGGKPRTSASPADP
jgi:hypothetical protein